MKKFNKTLLALGVAGALILPSMTMAATLSYVTGTQITFAKDLIVNNGTTINTPNSLRLTAESFDGANMATVGALAPGVVGPNVTVKVTLTDSAKFDSSAPAPALVAGFTEGTQFGGTGLGLTVVGTPYYSAGGQELNFTFAATGAGNTAAGYAFEINSLQITNLIDGLFVGNKVGAQITAQNQAGQQILASKADIALSKQGLAVSDVASPDLLKTIDVGSTPRKTLFSPTGAVGGSAVGGVPVAGSDFFNAGGFVLDIAKALPIGGGAATYINNFNAIATNPQYNVVATAEINVTVTGSDLTSFNSNKVWLDGSSTCSHVAAQSTNGTVNGGVATFTSPANIGIWAPVTAASPGPATAYVCFQADNVAELVAQDLSGAVSVDYKLSTQRVNPPALGFALSPLRLNGTNLVFQNVNPGGNPTAQSFLRLTNNTGQVCPVSIDAKDDNGLHTSNVTLTLAAHASMQLNADTLEGITSKPGVTGGFGDGTGKWYVRVSAECSNFKASALNRNAQTGTVTDLTPEKTIGIDWVTPPTSL